MPWQPWMMNTTNDLLSQQQCFVLKRISGREYIHHSLENSKELLNLKKEPFIPSIKEGFIEKEK